MKRRDDGLTFWTGEYVYPWSVWYPAEWLLHSLQDIRNDPLPALREVGEQVEIDFDPLELYVEMRRYLARAYRCYGLTVPVSRLALAAWSPGPVWNWAEQFNLYRPRTASEQSDVPITEVAFYFALTTLVALTLKGWAESPARRDARELARLPVLVSGADPLVCEGQYDEEVRLSVPAFTPCTETEADFLRRVTAAAKKHATTQVAADGPSMRCAGAFPRPHRLEVEHFRWLALYQIGGLSYPEIKSRASEEISLQGVRQGVHRAASLVVGRTDGWLRPALD